MSEPVVITPQAGRDRKGNPLPAGVPFTLNGRVAPGNTARTYGPGGDLEEVDFTIYFPLRARRQNPTTLEWRWEDVAELLTEDFTVTLRGTTCAARVQNWNDGGRGGIVVLAKSATGKA